MTDPLVVILYGEVAGRVEQSDGGELRLVYDDGWRFSRGATPVSLSMPLARAAHDHDVTSAFLWGLLPDNERVLERWARHAGVSARNPFALLGEVGEDCAGAVQLVRPDRLPNALDAGGVEPLTEDDIADALRELRVDPTAWHGARTGGRFSLAGAQAKLALLFDDGGWAKPCGRTPTTHILKPAIEGYVGHDLNEHLCLEAARRLGLPAAASEVVTFGEERAIVITRYDRLHTPDGWARIHQEDLCQAFGVPPTRKYQHDGGLAPEDITARLRSVQDPVTATESVLRFLDALVLNWLVVGADAHAKNYSLLLRRSQVRLAPLYDVASVLPYDDFHLPKVKLAMKVGAEYRVRFIRTRHWDRLATSAGIDPAQLRDRALTMARDLPQALADAAAVPAVRDLRSPLPTRLVDAVSGWAAECATTLQRGD